LDICSYLIFTGGDHAAAADDGKDEAAAKQSSEQADQDGEEAVAVGGPKQTQTRNQFNYSERAAQTFLRINRDKSTATEPPGHKAFSETVTQWAVYDAYVEDLAQKEKVKEKAKGSVCATMFIYHER
jgi:dynein intermediate chain 1